MKKILQATGFILIAQGAGLIGSFFTVNSIESWYVFLKKPPFVPLNRLFASVLFYKSPHFVAACAIPCMGIICYVFEFLDISVKLKPTWMVQ